MKVTLQSPVMTAGEKTVSNVVSAVETVQDDPGVEIKKTDGSTVFIGGYNIVAAEQNIDRVALAGVIDAAEEMLNSTEQGPYHDDLERDVSRVKEILEA